MPSQRRCLAILCVALPASVATPEAAQAQTAVTFTVVDSLTSRPIPGATIEISTSEGKQITAGRTDVNGRLILRVPPGAVVVRGEMLAYKPVGPVTIRVPGGDSAFVRFLLSPTPIATDSLAVTSRSRSIPRRWDRWGFDWRRVNRPFGVFYDRNELQKLGVHSVSALLRRFTGIRVVQSRFGAPFVYMTSGRFLDKWGGSTACGPAVYRNGVLVHDGGRGNPAPVDDLVQMSEITALELYREGAAVPVAFRPTPLGTCGAVVIWTR